MIHAQIEGSKTEPPLTLSLRHRCSFDELAAELKQAGEKANRDQEVHVVHIYECEEGKVCATLWIYPE